MVINSETIIEFPQREPVLRPLLQYEKDRRSPPFFSIILPVKLPCKHFESTLRSILNQQRLDAELVIVTTASLSPSEVSLVRLLNIEVKIFHQNACGVYHAMNFGLHKSKGEWIYYLGSGDTLNADVLTRVEETLRYSICEVFICKVNTSTDAVYPLFDVKPAKILKGFMPCHQGLFVRRELMNRVKGFDTRYLITADFDLIYRIVKGESRIENSEVVVARYLGGGISSAGALKEQFLAILRSGSLYNAITFYFIEILAKTYRKFVSPETRRKLKWLRPL
jgi:glycosyltransferase involved in cell wall biosynthesis